MHAAVEIARTEYDITLDLGDIATITVPKKYDAVTLWCVLAHVPEPDDLLRGAYDLLQPGGAIYLQTPHECSMDRVALSALTASKGRVSKIVDRRIAGHHWFLHTKKSMTTTMERLGFVDIQVEPRGRYPLQTSAYLQSLGVKGKPGQVAGRAIDQMIDKGVAPRIVLDVYARKPEDGKAPTLVGLGSPTRSVTPGALLPDARVVDAGGGRQRCTPSNEGVRADAQRPGSAP